MSASSCLAILAIIELVAHGTRVSTQEELLPHMKMGYPSGWYIIRYENYESVFLLSIHGNNVIFVLPSRVYSNDERCAKNAKCVEMSGETLVPAD